MYEFCGRAYDEAVTPGFSISATVLEKGGERTDPVEPEVSLTSPPATPPPQEAPVVYAPIGPVVVGMLALALKCRG